ncbi:MAG: hypothetical protein R6X12_03315, partial [bacterium]
MVRFLLIPTIVVLLALALPALGQDSLNCRQVGLWPGDRGGEPEGHSVVLDPDRGLAFLGMDSTRIGDEKVRGAYVLDVSNPSEPRMLSAIRPVNGNPVTGLALASNRLYLGSEA